MTEDHAGCNNNNCNHKSQCYLYTAVTIKKHINQEDTVNTAICYNFKFNGIYN